jgi:HemY protein
MKGIFWFLGLAATAVALALLVGSNDANVTLFWHPWRIDLSFNFALFGLLLLFALFHAALRALALLRNLPQQAQRWRTHQLERAAQASVLDALAQQYAGRFVRSQASARQALAQLDQLGAHAFPGREQARMLAQLLVAENAHELGQTEARERALAEALASPAASQSAEARAVLQLRAAAWSLERRDASAAARWLAELPQGIARRIHALRLRLRLARLQQDHGAAIELVRLLTKHHAYSEQAARSLLRGLVLDALRATRDPLALERLWLALSARERASPELALAALDQWDALAALDAAVQEPGRLIASAIESAWAAYADLDTDLRRRLILRLESALSRLGPDWLARIEQVQQREPADAGLQYLAGQAFLQHQLWGKAASLLERASQQLSDAELTRRCWRSLAQLAEQRGDLDAARAAWKQAALR